MDFYIETEVKFLRVGSNGKMKKVTQHYLINAMTFAEAEKKIIEYVTPFISGEFSVSAVKKAHISEIFHHEGGDKWYEVKTSYIMLDEGNGKEKRQTIYYLVQAGDFAEALANFNEDMKQTVADYEIIKIVETKLLDVFISA